MSHNGHVDKSFYAHTIQLGISPFQLTFTHIFQRDRYTTNQYIYIYSTDRPIGSDLFGLLPPARWYINIFNIGQGVCEFNKNDGPSGVNSVKTRILR